MEEKIKFKKTQPEGKFSFYSTLLTSSLITFILLFSVGYTIIYMRNIAAKQDEQVKRTLSTLLFSIYASDSKTKNYSNLNNTVDILYKGNVLNNVYIVEKGTDKILWSIKDVNKGQIYTPQTIKLSPKLKKQMTITRVDSIDYYMILGYWYIAKQSGEDVNLLVSYMTYFILAFLVIGIAVSALMSTFLSSPLNTLVKSVKEFSKGQFNQNIKKTRIQEINELIDAYNEMAKQLQELYSSLETKVQERTLELKQTNDELKQTQAMMVHSEKMRSLGELVAGIAHEINNPINFIYGNMVHLERYSNDLLHLIDLYSEDDKYLPEDKRLEIQKAKKEIDLEFLSDDIKDLINSCKEGTERTKKIILDLKNFSRLEENVLSEFDIPKEVETTLNILNNKLKNRITIHKNYQNNLPKIEVYGGQLNQVIMNILDNAQYAIQGKGDIYIDAMTQGQDVVIKIRDTGKGIDEKNLERIFDPFYTTKPIGEGTGLGLSIAYKVVKNHKGKMTATSKLGEGTTFTIILPIKHDEARDEI